MTDNAWLQGSHLSFAISEWWGLFLKEAPPSPHNTQDICVCKINFLKNHSEELPFSSKCDQKYKEQSKYW